MTEIRLLVGICMAGLASTGLSAQIVNPGAGGGSLPTTDASQLSTGTLSNARLPPAIVVPSVTAQSFTNNSPYNNHVDLSYTGTADPAAVAAHTVRIGVATDTTSPYTFNIPPLPGAGILTATLNSNGDVVSTFAPPTLPASSTTPLVLKAAPASTTASTIYNPPTGLVYVVMQTDASNNLTELCRIHQQASYNATYSQVTLQWVNDTCTNAQMQLVSFGAGFQGAGGQLSGFAQYSDQSGNFFTDGYGDVQSIVWRPKNATAFTAGNSCGTVNDWFLGANGTLLYCSSGKVWTAK